MNRNILIIGGTRFVGPQLIEKLLNNGDQVTVFCRGTDYGTKISNEIKTINGNRENPNDLKKISSNKYDLIYDMCCFSEQHAKDLLKIINGNFDHLAFFSTAAVYQKPVFFPLTEESQLGEWSSFGDYGTRKAEAENTFVSFAKKNNKKITIFRPVYLLGKDNYFDRENYYFSRIIKREPILVPGNGAALIQFAFLEETINAFFSCPLKQDIQIEILNIGGNEYISIKNFVNLCGQIANKPPLLVYPNMKNNNLDEERFYDDLYPFPNVSLILDNSKIKQKYGIKFEPLESGLIKIYQHWKQTWKGEVKKSEKEIEIL